MSIGWHYLHSSLPGLLLTASSHAHRYGVVMRELAVTQQEYPDFIYSQATIMIMISLALHISYIYAGQQPTKSLISYCRVIFEYEILYCHTRVQLGIQLDLNSYKSLLAN